ncbi:MAG: hypothetical protein ABI600_07430 [Luteolibacter sp.]
MNPEPLAVQRQYLLPRKTGSSPVAIFVLSASSRRNSEIPSGRTPIHVR